MNVAITTKLARRATRNAIRATANPRTGAIDPKVAKAAFNALHTREQEILATYRAERKHRKQHAARSRRRNRSR